MFGIGPTEILLIAIVIMVLFGAKKIPDILKGMGRGIKDFKKEVNNIEETIKS